MEKEYDFQIWKLTKQPGDSPGVGGKWGFTENDPTFGL